MVKCTDLVAANVADVCLYQCLFSIDLQGRKVKIVSFIKSPKVGCKQNLDFWVFRNYYLDTGDERFQTNLMLQNF